MVIKRFSNMLGSRHGANPFHRSRSHDAPEDSTSISRYGEDTPEGAAGRGVRLFCESGGPNNQGEEVLHLPVIVEAAESSPAAAGVAAQQIRKFLSKDNYNKPHVQYNAIMLIRILSDNPGATFTRHIDQKFTSTVKQLLREGRDQSVQQILRETLQALYLEKAYDTNLATLFQMWSKESGLNIHHSARVAGVGQNGFTRPARPARQPDPAGGSVFSGPNLPPPIELAARIEEAKTSAKLLQQLVQSTPPEELQENDLIKEFAERCQTAQKSMQGFMNCTNPSPDDDTMQTLIETSEQLSLAASKHQRAVLQARRAGHNPSPAPISPPVNSGFAPPTIPPPVTASSNLVQPPAATFVPAETAENTMYEPPPVPPPGMRESLARKPVREGDLSAKPPSLAQPPSLKPRNGPPQLPEIRTGVAELPSPGYANPFSDNNGTRVRDDSRPPVPDHIRTATPEATDSETDISAPHTKFSAAGSMLATVGARPPPPRMVDSWRDQPTTGQNQSYNPTFQTSPSFVKRQESSGDNLTMRGAAAGSGTSLPDSRIQESAGRYGAADAYSASSHAAGNGGGVSPDSEAGNLYGYPTPASHGRRYSFGEPVSPISIRQPYHPSHPPSAPPPKPPMS